MSYRGVYKAWRLSWGRFAINRKTGLFVWRFFYIAFSGVYRLFQGRLRCGCATGQAWGFSFDMGRCGALYWGVGVCVGIVWRRSCV